MYKQTFLSFSSTGHWENSVFELWSVKPSLFLHRRFCSVSGEQAEKVEVFNEIVLFSEGGDSHFTQPRAAASFTIFQDEQDKENIR